MRVKDIVTCHRGGGFARDALHSLGIPGGIHICALEVTQAVVDVEVWAVRPTRGRIAKWKAEVGETAEPVATVHVQYGEGENQGCNGYCGRREQK